MPLEALLAASRRWRAERAPSTRQRADVLVLCCDGDTEGGHHGIPDDWQLLIDAVRARGLRVELADWDDAATDLESVACALPLLTWDYCEKPVEFRCFLARLLKAGVEPTADLRAIDWIMHKQYLIDLADVGIQTVPTVLLARGSGVDALREAMRKLAAQCVERVDGQRVYVSKPALGSRGDGVEQLLEGDAAGESQLLTSLRSRDVLLQPFLGGVRHEGELCVVYINGKLLHVVRKDPAGWSQRHVAAHDDGDGGGGGDGAGGDGEGVCGGDDSVVQHACPEQPVALLHLPPATAMAVADQALTHVQARFATASKAGCGFIARVDLLPFRGAWVLSELELGWGSLFLRARPAAAAEVALALEEHIGRGGRTSTRSTSESQGGGRPAGRKRPLGGKAEGWSDEEVGTRGTAASGCAEGAR